VIGQREESRVVRSAPESNNRELLVRPLHLRDRLYHDLNVVNPVVEESLPAALV
jgi:hypothetical protein